MDFAGQPMLRGLHAGDVVGIYAIKIWGFVNIFIGVISGCVQVIAIVTGLTNWLGFPWFLSILLSVMLVGVPALVILLGDRLLKDDAISWLSQHLIVAKWLSRTQLLPRVNIVFVFIGAWKGFGWLWWQAALLVAGLIVIPMITMTVQTTVQRRL
jgi:hypothetical protein